MIEVIVNDDTRFLLHEEFLRGMLKAFVPAFFMDSNAPAPDEISDIIRNALKGLAVVPTGMGKPNVFQTLMFTVYGATAPKIEKRADKLPYMWKAVIDHVVAKTSDRRLIIEVQERGEGTYVIVAINADAVHRPSETENTPVENGEYVSSVE